MPLLSTNARQRIATMPAHSTPERIMSLTRNLLSGACMALSILSGSPAAAGPMLAPIGQAHTFADRKSVV